MARMTGRLRRLTVGDVMTTSVVTASESATFHDMASLMKKHGISALPVVGADGALVGIVSEADLLMKKSPPSEHSRLLPESRERRTARAKSHAVNAGDVMTRAVVTVTACSPLAVAARLMQEHRIKRLPVVGDDGAVIGIVSRRDLLTAFTRSDEEIRRNILDGVLPGWLGIDPADVAVAVDGGVVSLRGSVDRRSDVDIVEDVVASLDGVVRVDAELTYRFDDRHIGTSRELHVQ